MKKFVRRAATGLVGAHITGALSIRMIIVDYDKELASEPLDVRVMAYILAPYFMIYYVGADALERLEKAIRHSAS